MTIDFSPLLAAKHWVRALRTHAALHALVLVAVLLGLCGGAWAQHSAARIMVVSGSAKAVDPQGRERQLAKGAELFSGDKVVTADGALVQMRLNDGGYLSVRAGSEMVIDRFVHDEKDASNSSFLVSLLRGGFRSITGLIGRSNPSGYQIRASTATIGIRGTDHEPMVILDTPEAQAQGEPGLYDKVNEGETFIRNLSGTLSLKRGDVGFASFSTELPPQVLLKVPDFYKVEVKTDAREPKDDAEGPMDGKTDGRADGKPDGNKRAPAAGTLLRPSVAARRAALQAAGANAGPTGQTPTDRVAPAPPPAGTALPTTTALPSIPTAGSLNTAPAPTAPTGTVLTAPKPSTAPTTTLTAPKPPPTSNPLSR